jgi:hypothetical protein
MNEQALRAVVVSAFVYVGIVASGALVILMDSTRAGVPLTPLQGWPPRRHPSPASGWPSSSPGRWARSIPFSDASKVVLTALMSLGRLQVIHISFS